jgi:pyruvate carboxylase subunit B
MKKETKKDEPGFLNINNRKYTTRLSRKFLDHKPYQPADPGIVRSFMPGTVLDLLVSVGQKVSKGDDLLVLDSMKMKNRIRSSVEGVVEKIEVKPGDKVSKGSLLLRLK